MRAPRRSPLFSAVVLAGASLASACGSTTTGPGAADAKAPDDAAAGSDAADAALEAGDAGTCPPGSERPIPPCALIK